MSISMRHLPFWVCCASLALGGCDPEGPASDGGLYRDATFTDSGGLLDGGIPEAGPPRPDGSISDAGGPACDTSTCDPRSGEGCGAPSSCVLVEAEPACHEAAGGLAPGMDCTSTEDCAVGAACFEVEGRGLCARICCPGDSAACDGDQTCGGSGRLVDGTASEWGRCLPRRTCDVLDPTSTCEAREGCYIVDLEGTTECRYAGTAGAGEPCVDQQDCQAGFFCGGIGAAKSCRRICDLARMDCPAAEGRCVRQAHSPDGSGICTLDMATREQMSQ